MSDSEEDDVELSDSVLGATLASKVRLTASHVSRTLGKPPPVVPSTVHCGQLALPDHQREWSTGVPNGPL